MRIRSTNPSIVAEITKLRNFTIKTVIFHCRILSNDLTCWREKFTLRLYGSINVVLTISNDHNPINHLWIQSMGTKYVQT